MGSIRHRRKLAPGTIISARYQVVCCIGSGGMGTVYEVRHRRLDRPYAAKVLAFDLANDYTSLARFRREAEIVAGLRHPNIVDIIDWEHLDDGTPCMIMEYLHGESLADRIQSVGALSWGEIASIGTQVASALSMAHRAGIVHRDLKPDNIYLARTETGEEVAKLLDFGVSKIRHGNTLATQDFTLLGTPAYMSPEQADSRSDEIDETTDLWALGAILYEMASNRPAFHAESVPSLLYKVCYSDPIPLVEYRADAPPGFIALIGRALDRERTHRFTSADELSTALVSALAAAAPGARSGPGGQLRLETGDSPADPGRPEGDGDATVRTPAMHQHTTFSQASGETQTAHVGRSRRRTGLSLLLALALIGVGLGVGLLVAGTGSETGSRDSSNGQASEAKTPAAAVSPTPVGPDAVTPAAGPEPAAVAPVSEPVESAEQDPPQAEEPGPRQPKSVVRTPKRKRPGKSVKKKRPAKRTVKSPVRKKGEPVNPFATP